MPSYYDDNFGIWDGMDDEENVEFYHQVQAESVEKICEGCGHTVMLRPSYGICNSCASKVEQGLDIY